MTKEEKRALGRDRLDALLAEHGHLAELQMVMGLTSGMLQFIDPTQLDARNLLALVGAMSDEEWSMGVVLTVETVKQKSQTLLDVMGDLSERLKKAKGDA